MGWVHRHTRARAALSAEGGRRGGGGARSQRRATRRERRGSPRRDGHGVGGGAGVCTPGIIESRSNSFVSKEDTPTDEDDEGGEGGGEKDGSAVAGWTDGRTTGGEASQGVEYHCIVIELDLHIGAGPAASTHRERGGGGERRDPLRGRDPKRDERPI